MLIVGTLASVCHGGGLVAALVLVAINTEGVKKKKKRKLTCWAHPSICRGWGVVLSALCWGCWWLLASSTLGLVVCSVNSDCCHCHQDAVGVKKKKKKNLLLLLSSPSSLVVLATAVVIAGEVLVAVSAVVVVRMLWEKKKRLTCCHYCPCCRCCHCCHCWCWGCWPPSLSSLAFLAMAIILIIAGGHCQCWEPGVGVVVNAGDGGGCHACWQHWGQEC